MNAMPYLLCGSGVDDSGADDSNKWFAHVCVQGNIA
jgi:hypothetical protein